MNRREKIEIMEQLIASPGWRLIADEMRKLITAEQMKAESLEGDDYRDHVLVKRGLEIALHLPETMRKQNESYFRRAQWIYEKFTGKQEDPNG